ncbi:MAG: hypothetical protein SH819_04270 [Cytophagales bacterium]|nr:hypothetical protein [Cytophagales bacterium]
MYLFLIVLLGVCAVSCQGQSVNTRLGARAAAMGYATFAVADETSVFNNVGSLARVPQSGLIFCYESAAELPGANRTGAGITIRKAASAIALGFFRFGDPVYHEQLVSAAYGNRIGNTSLGVKVNYVQYRADGFGTRSTVTADVGGLTQITPQLAVGAGVYNITQSAIAENEELPVILVAAIGFQPTPLLLLVAEAEKRLGSPLTVKGGAEVAIYKKIFVRTGFNLNPTSLHTGIGAKTHRISIDYAIRFSHLLGFAQHASASVRLHSGKGK